MNTPDCFWQYKGGILKESDCPCQTTYSNDSDAVVNHGVTIVGYVSNSTAVEGCSGWWIAKNSYGTLWGEDGYFRACIPSEVPDDEAQFGTCNINAKPMIPDVGLIDWSY